MYLKKCSTSYLFLNISFTTRSIKDMPTGLSNIHPAQYSASNSSNRRHYLGTKTKPRPLSVVHSLHILFQYANACKCPADRKNDPGIWSPLQDRRKWRRVQWHRKQSGYPRLIQPQLVVNLSPLPWSPSFNSLPENSSFHIYCHFKASTNSRFCPNHSERTEILQQTHMHSWQEPPHTLSQTHSICTFSHILLYCQDDFQAASENYLRAHKSKPSLVGFQHPSSTTYSLQTERYSFPMWPH